MCPHDIEISFNTQIHIGKRLLESADNVVLEANQKVDPHEIAYLQMVFEWKSSPSTFAPIEYVPERDDVMSTETASLPSIDPTQAHCKEGGKSKSRNHLPNSDWRERAIRTRLLAIFDRDTTFSIFLQRLYDRAMYIQGQRDDITIPPSDIQIPLSVHINEQSVPMNVEISHQNMLKEAEILLIRAFDMCESAASRFEETDIMNFNIFDVQNGCNMADMVNTVEKELKKLETQKQIRLDKPLANATVRSLLIAQRNMEISDSDRHSSSDLSKEERESNITMSPLVAGFPTCMMNQVSTTTSAKSTNAKDPNTKTLQICKLDAAVFIRELLNKSFLPLPVHLQSTVLNWRTFTPHSSTGSPVMTDDVTMLFITLDTIWRKNNKKLFNGVKSLGRLVSNFLDYIGEMFLLNSHLEVISISITKYTFSSSTNYRFSFCTIHSIT